MEGLFAIAPTNAVYKSNHYQDALKSLAGTYGMTVTFFREEFDENSLNTSDAVQAGIYTYLAYISEQMQKDGTAANETEAVTIAMGEVLEYIFDMEINVDTLTLDEFAAVLAEYITEHEDDEIGKTMISAIAENIPDDQKSLVSTMIGGFHKDFTIAGSVPLEELLRVYIKACHEGADPECAQAPYYETPEKVRTTLYTMIYLIAYTDMPELQPLLMDPLTWQFTGPGLFKDLLALIKGKFMVQKDEDGKVIKEYVDFGEIADEKMTLFLDSLLLEDIEKSEELYGAEYKEAFDRQFSTLKEYITEAREIIASMLFYSEEGANIAETVETVATFAGNAMQIPLAHFDEIYLAQARTSNRYESHTEENFTQIPSLIDGVGIKKYQIESGTILVVTLPEENSDDLYLYTAVYDIVGRLVSSEMTDFVSDGDDMSAAFSEPTLDDGEEYGIYIWDSQLRPYISAIRSGGSLFK